MGAGVRVLHQADIGALPLAGIPGWRGGDRGRRGMTSGGCPRYSRRALAVQWEQWVLAASLAIRSMPVTRVVRKIVSTWSPVMGSNRRPSPYHGVPIGAPARRFGERPDQRLCFSSVGTGSGRFAPDATSQIPPNRSRRRSPYTAPVTPGPISVRYALPPGRKIVPKRSAAGSAPTAAHRAMMTRPRP